MPGGEVWRCGGCHSPNSPLHRMCTSCKKWRDLDWSCVMCGYKNFSKRDTCKECGAGHVPEFNKEEGNYNVSNHGNYSNHGSVYQEVEEAGGYQDPHSVPAQPSFQAGILDTPYQAPVEPPYQEQGELPWMCGMCNTENTPKRILCFECSGHRERVEVRNRAAENRRHSLPPPPLLSPHRDVSRVQYHQGGAVEDQTLDWLCSNCNNRNFAKRTNCNVCKKGRDEVEMRREIPPWIEPPLSTSHIRDQPRHGSSSSIPLERPEDKTKDWACSGCSNRNFAKRQECNRCKKPREEVEDKTVDYACEETPSLKRGPDPFMRVQIKAPRYGPTPQRYSLTPPRQDFYPQRQSLMPPRHGPTPRQEDLSNDWVCGKCNINCFAKKTNCFRCGKPRSEVENREADLKEFDRPVVSYPAPPVSRPQQHNVSGHSLRINTGSSWNHHPPPPMERKRKWVDEDKANDWNCRLCKINNFAKRKSCFSCNKNRGECEERNEKSDIVKVGSETEVTNLVEGGGD